MQVNTSEVMTLSESIISINDKISNAFESASSAMDALSGSWTGEAGENALSKYNKLKSEIEYQFNVVSKYAEFLKNRVSIGYEQVEDANIKLSDAFK